MSISQISLGTRPGADLASDILETTQEDQYLTFRLADQEYGIGIGHITEIVGLQKITQVPDMPAFVRGVINLRGTVIPVVDIRTRFQMEPRPYDDRTCIIVVDIRKLTIGLIVDTVCEVVSILPAAISPPPPFQEKQGGRYVQGMGRLPETVVVILAVDRLLFDEELSQIAPSPTVASPAERIP